jgi:hypothetical protein
MSSRLRSQLHSYNRMQYARTKLRLFPTEFTHQNAIYKDHTQGYSQMHSYTRMQFARTRLRAVPSCMHTPECSIQGPDSGLFPAACIHQNAVCKDQTQGCSQLHSYTRMQFARTRLRAVSSCIHTPECSLQGPDSVLFPAAFIHQNTVCQG